MAAIKLKNIKIRIILFIDALCYNALNNGIAYHSIGNQIPLQVFIRKDDSMNTILEQYKDKINGSFSFFDRMIIKITSFNFFSFWTKIFLSSLDVLLKDFSAYAEQVTRQIVSHVENMAAS